MAGKTYTSYSTNHLTATGYAPSLHYVNNFNMENLRRLSGMSERVSFSLLLEALVALVVGAALYTIWRKLTSTKGIPVVTNSTPDPETLNAGRAPKAL